jgi:hypothetical protein
MEKVPEFNIRTYEIAWLVLGLRALYLLEKDRDARAAQPHLVLAFFLTILTTSQKVVCKSTFYEPINH